MATKLTSWIAGADESEFPVQNLPFGVFSHLVSGREPRIGVAIGPMVVDMKALLTEGLLDGLTCAPVFASATLNAFMAQPKAERVAVREFLTQLLLTSGTDERLHASPELQAACLVPLAEVGMHLPATIGDYTDFYSSRDHATNVGIMFRGKDNALQPNWLHLPVGYHGRASSVVLSGTPVTRPKGQLQLDKEDPSKGSEHAACRLLDFELEIGFFVGGPPNALGAPLTMEQADERIFGFVLCNDWSARDIQKFEYVPLGPFGAKNFCTSISAWVVMTEALAAFRCATSAGAQDPTPLPYLRDPNYSSYDVALEVTITPAGAAAGTVVSRSNYKNMYWTCTQQLVHHSVTGCNMLPGDLLASGTISGAESSAYGSMLELCWQGTKEVGPLADGSVRKFLKDGDTVTIRGKCTHPSGFSIGFGECAGQPLARARAREIAEVINAGTQPLSNLSHMNAITAATEGADGRAIGKAAMIKGLLAAEALAARNRDCRFCVGAHTSVADLCIVPQLYNARRFGIDLAPYPRLLCVEEHAATLQYFQVAHPNVQPDAVEDAQEDAPPKRPNSEEEAQ